MADGDFRIAIALFITLGQQKFKSHTQIQRKKSVIWKRNQYSHGAKRSKYI